MKVETYNRTETWGYYSYLHFLLQMSKHENNINLRKASRETLKDLKFEETWSRRIIWHLNKLKRRFMIWVSFQTRLHSQNSLMH